MRLALIMCARRTRKARRTKRSRRNKRNRRNRKEDLEKQEGQEYLKDMRVSDKEGKTSWEVYQGQM